jgi:hypothetical protein
VTVTPYPLGRVQYHDPRNAQPQYAVAELPRRALKSVDWHRRAPIFDQGQLGSCVGNAAVGWVGTDNVTRQGRTFVDVSSTTAMAALTGDARLDTGSGPKVLATVPVDEALAVRDYAFATGLDTFSGTYPPDDTGTDGPSGAKALVKLGLAGKYTHAFSLAALQAALQLGPVMWGTVWYNSMFDLNSYNHLVVDENSGVAGGHELLIVGWDTATDVYKIANSWGTSWGEAGYCYVNTPDLTYLAAQGGDFTQPVDLAAPAPSVVTAQKFYDQIKASATAGGLK